MTGYESGPYPPGSCPPGCSNTARVSNATQASHAYIAQGAAAGRLAVSVVCSNPIAGENGRFVPCMACNNCKKAAAQIHPDIINVEKPKDKREIIIDQIRALRRDANVLPNDSERKAYIIHDAHLMNLNAQNALLRVLEEPPSFVTFILQTDNPSSLLETVRSRCVLLRPDSAQPDGAVPEDCGGIYMLAGDFIKALGSNLPLAKMMFSLDKLDKAEFSTFINAARGQLSPALRDPRRRKKAAEAGDLLTRAGEMLDLNVNTGHISGMLCASLIDT